MSSITAERAIGRIGTITANYLEADGRHQYLLLNANAPLPGTGVRPLGEENIYQFTSEGTGHEQMFFSNLNLMPRRWLSVFAFYVAQRDHSDANGPTSFASNSYNIRQDYGRDDSDIGQNFFMGGAINLPHGLAVQPFLSARSGRPFNITIGSDPNGDTIYNDRPAFATDLSRPSVVRTAYGNFDTNPLPSQTIIPYNYGIGPALFWVDLQANETIHIGPRPALKASAAPGPKAGPQSPHQPERPWTLAFSVEAQNLFNHTNPANPVGVLSSRFFGQSLSIANDFTALTAANRTHPAALQLHLLAINARLVGLCRASRKEKAGSRWLPALNRNELHYLAASSASAPAFNASALSVASHVNVSPVRPKCP